MKQLRHKIYTGAFEALEISFKETIVELQCNDPLAEVSVLVGSNILATYLRRQLAKDGRPAANIRFYNFLNLVRHITGSSFSYSDNPKLPSLGAAVILESLLEDRDNLPKAYASLAGYKGFRDALLGTFRDLRDADITPSDLNDAVKTGRRAADRRELLESFANMYRRYRDIVGRFRDTDDDFRAAMKKLSQRPENGEYPPLLVYGVYDATGQQTGLLDALSLTRPMIYFIPIVDSAVSEFARPFLNTRVSNLGVAPECISPPAKTDSLGRLAERQFGFSREPIHSGALTDDGSFALVSAPGESRVAIEVVREILQAVRDGVISGFHEAAVVLRRPQSDIPILSEALRLRKIPYFIHGGDKFSNRPICKAVLALSGLKAADFSRDAILNAVEFIGAVLQSEIGAEKWDIENWLVLTREAEALTGISAWDATVRKILRLTVGTVRRLEQTPETKPEKLAAARERLDAARRLRQNWRKLRAVAADWPARATYAEWSEFLRRRFGKMLKKSPDWTYVLTVLDEIAELETLSRGFTQSGMPAENEISADRIRSILEEAVLSPAYPAGKFQRSGVNILGVSAARGLRFPLVVIPGLEEKHFPSRLRQDPLLPDAERRRLAGMPLRGARAGEEKLLFDMAARSASKRLVLLTSRLDESADREKFPSLFFINAASAVNGGRIAQGGFNAEKIPGCRSVSLDAAAPSKGISAVDGGEIRLRWITSGNIPPARALSELALMEPRRLRLPMEYERMRRENRLTKFDGLISNPELLQWARQKLDADSGRMSASRFEGYARCPYSFFLKHVLNLRILDDEPGIRENMDPLERGTAVHAALESFLKNHAREGFDSASTERLWNALEGEARRELERNRPIGMPGLLWDIELDKLLTMLRNWLEFEISRADGDMRIARLEQAFGNFSEFPPFRPDVEGTKKIIAKDAGVAARRYSFENNHAGNLFLSYWQEQASRLQALENSDGTTVFPFRLPDGQAKPEGFANTSNFEFCGKIDRVDISADGKRARIIDYKTGKLPDSMKKVDRHFLMGGEKIQLAVYRGALAALEEFAALESVEAEYLYLQPKDGFIRQSALAPEQMEAAFADLPRVLRTLDSCMKNGVFFARTRSNVFPNGHCDYCDFLPVCGKDRAWREKRKINDPAIQAFQG